MRRIRPLLTALAIPLALLLVGLLLGAISPWRQPGPIIRLQVGSERASAAAFDSRALHCSEQQVSGAYAGELRLTARCSLLIAGQPLTVDVAHEGIIGRCAASYAGVAVPCESIVSLYNSHLPSVFVQSDLGLTGAVLRSLPGTNPLFYLSERDWLFVQLALAAFITGGALLLGGARLALPRFSAVAIARAAGYAIGTLLLFGGVWFGLLFAFFSSGFVD